MSILRLIVNGTIKIIIEIICRIDKEALKNIPERGPLIVTGNHINFLDVPLLYTQLYPRPMTGLVKAETWDNPFLNFLFNIWEGIPIKRGQLDIKAMEAAQNALNEGKLMAISPEGTRSKTGILGRGNPGVVLLAIRTQTPILPVIFYGNEQLISNLKRLKRTDFHIRVGNRFQLKPGIEKPDRETRRLITDEIMYQIAALMPEQYRGLYADLSKATTDFLVFENPTDNNLLFA